MACSDTTGSWYNSGFHGHFRSKSRLDFINEYRHLAKPAPPKKYLWRATQRATKHPFSHHDNRNSFMNDALYFEQGLGKKSFLNASTKFQPEFLTWYPTKKELDKANPHISMYKLDFRGAPTDSKKQVIIKRPKTSFDNDQPTVTTYRYAHGSYNPNQGRLTAMSNDGLSTVPNRRQRASTAYPSRESVASCMSWYSGPTRSKRALVPAATETMPPMVPHPPPMVPATTVTNVSCMAPTEATPAATSTQAVAVA